MKKYKQIDRQYRGNAKQTGRQTERQVIKKELVDI